MYLKCHATSQSHVNEGSRTFMVCHGVHFVTSGDHRYSSSRDIMLLVRHVILQDHVIKLSGDYINRNLPR